jgi:hypothetical protein
MTDPRKEFGPEARERSEPSGTTTHAHCPPIEAVNQVLRSYYCDDSLDGQRTRLLDVLCISDVTSLVACDKLEVEKPHEHVAVLRAEGYNIQASFFWMTYPDGKRRYATQYELKAGEYRPWVRAEGDRP